MTNKRDDDINIAVHTTCPVLITGGQSEEREQIARRIHGTGPFVKLDCARTGPSSAELWQPARSGTVYFEHVNEMSLEMQARVFEFLGEQAFARGTGSTAHLRDGQARVIAGTTRSLMDRLTSGQFRADVFYRLNTIHIELSRGPSGDPTRGR